MTKLKNLLIDVNFTAFAFLINLVELNFVDFFLTPALFYFTSFDFFSIFSHDKSKKASTEERHDEKLNEK